MAVYANENGNIKELTSKADYGNGFIINGVEYLGEYDLSGTPSTATASVPKTIGAYKYLIFIAYGHTNNNTSEDDSQISVLIIDKCLRNTTATYKIQLSLFRYSTGKYAQTIAEATDLSATSINLTYSYNGFSDMYVQIFGIY